MVLPLVQAAATLFMFGVILTIQIVHYPLFAVVGDDRFVAYHRIHMQRIGRVVIVPMIAELASAAALIIWRDPGIPLWLAVSGLALAAIIWISTWVVMVPLHRDLEKGFDSVVHARLVESNRVRTLAWGLRSIVVLAMMYLPQLARGF